MLKEKFYHKMISIHTNLVKREILSQNDIHTYKLS